MPLTLQQKKELVEGYRSGVSASPHVFVLGFKGITVPQVTELRRLVREQGGSYQVVKNRLLLRAIGGSALEGLQDRFGGPNAVVYGDDPVALAKVLTEFAKEAEGIEFKAGLVEGQEVSGAEIVEIATLPSRDELIAKLLFLLQSPVTRFARALAAIPRQFVVVLEQLRQQKEGAGDAGD